MSQNYETLSPEELLKRYKDALTASRTGECFKGKTICLGPGDEQELYEEILSRLNRLQAFDGLSPIIDEMHAETTKALRLVRSLRDI